MTSPHDAFLLALSEERVRLLHVFSSLPPVEIKVARLSKSAEEVTRRPSIHVRAPRGHLQNLEGEKILIHQYAHRVDHALHSVLAGRDLPLVLAAAEPLASIFRTVNTYPRLVDDMIAGSPDHVTDAQLADAALPILDRLYRRELEAVIALFDELKPRRATDDVSYAAHAATAGAIAQLVVDLDASSPAWSAMSTAASPIRPPMMPRPTALSTKSRNGLCARGLGFWAHKGRICLEARP